MSKENEDVQTIDSYWNFQDAKASEVSFRRLVSEATDENYRVEAMTQLARSLGLQQRFDEAQSVIDEATGILTAEMPRAAIRLELEQGRVLNSSGQPTESISYFEKALDLATAANSEYLAVDAAHMLGIVSEPEIAIAWNEKAIKMAERATDPRARGWLGALYNNLAWTYNDLGEHEKALALFTKDVSYRTENDQPFEESIALWSKAKTLRLLGRVKEALDIQLGLVDHPLRKGNFAEGYTHEEIGECLLLLDRKAEAQGHFAIAYKRLSEDPWVVRNESERLERLKTLSASAN